MNVLTIGNSFSEDSTRYLHGIAKSDGVDIQVANCISVVALLSSIIEICCLKEELMSSNITVKEHVFLFQ